MSKKIKYFVLLSVFLLLMAGTILETSASAEQPTGKLTIVITQTDWFGHEEGVGEGTPIYIYNSQNRLAVVGKTDSVSQRTFELPYDTYVIYGLYDIRYSSFFGNDCYTPPFTLNESEEFLLIECHRMIYLRLPWIRP